jgi:hypothetical protein
MNPDWGVLLSPQRRRPNRTEGPGVVLNDIVKRSTLPI